jgi:RNA polymerase sigma-70 factor, ECF subfamily
VGTTKARNWERLSEQESLEIVTQVSKRNSAGLEHLYGLINRFRPYLLTHLDPSDVDDCLHQVFVVAVEAIRKGSVRSPERLLEFLSGVIRYSILAVIRIHIRSRREVSINSAFDVSDSKPDPECTAYELELRELRSRLLAGMPCRHYEILYKFYVEEQPKEQIQQEMHLTDTQFRLLKSRAKASLNKRAESGLATARF